MFTSLICRLVEYYIVDHQLSEVLPMTSFSTISDLVFVLEDDYLFLSAMTYDGGLDPRSIKSRLSYGNIFSISDK